MEISWKLINLCLGLLLFQLCNGFPINLESNPADSHSQLLTGLVAVLLTVCSVVFLAGCLCCQRRNGFKEFRDSPVVASTASNLDHGHVNPIANGEFTIFTPLSPPHQNNNVFLANQQIITRTPDDYSYGDVDVRSWFDEQEKDFPRIKLKYIREMGRGWFGKVVEGAAQDIGEDHQLWTPVVVRILEASAPSRERVSFLHEAAIYRCGSHTNLLKLIGRCLDTIPLLLLQEYCPQGDLKNYLRQNKSKSDNSVLSTEYPLVWCCQLTSALKFLHDNNVTHPDLASRNCQLTSNLTLKLGDYGLSIQRYPQDYYQGSPGIPVRWSAPESLICTSTTIQPKKITKEANIWSLGVTMWEICECGEQPYSSLNDDEVVSQVLGSPNVRLTRPSFTVLYTDYVYRLMQLCWTTAEFRPAVAQIDLMLADLLQVHKNTTNSSWSETSMSTDDFDKRWESFKPNDIVKTDNQMTGSVSTLESGPEIEITKPLSPSLNNLHGSLDNLGVNSGEKIESWIENESESGKVLFVKCDKDFNNGIDMDVISSTRSSPNVDNIKHIEFKLGPTPHSDQQSTISDSLNGSILHRSSESETEDENWRKKIELGAYTEKVRLKSKSVADLMVLTHIDYSESEPETPLPSLDYRVNYKNVRYAPKNNLENVSMTFGSEGNLLSVQDTFQEELRKLQDERRDSLLFVPDKHSQNSENNLEDIEDLVVKNVSNQSNDSPSKRLMQELNSGSEIKPANQVYNVFNVTIDKFSPLHVNNPVLQDIINLKDIDDHTSLEINVNKNISESEPYLSSVITLMSNKNTPETTSEIAEPVAENVKQELIIENADSGIIDKNKMLSVRLDNPVSSSLDKTFTSVPTLVEIIESRDELMDYIVQNYNYDSIDDDIELSGGEDESKLKVASNNDVKINGEDNKVTEIIVNSSELSISQPKEPVEETGNKPKVNFDLSNSQEATTHSSVFTSTPFRKKNLQDLSKSLEDTYSSLNIYSLDQEDGIENLQFSSNFAPLDKSEEDNQHLNYSLETWDNFLGKTLDSQSQDDMFDSFSSEPQSLLFLENDDAPSEKNKNITENLDSEPYDNNLVNESNSQTLTNVNDGNKTFVLEKDSNSTFTINDHVDNTFVIEDQQDGNKTFEVKKGEKEGAWESGGGWFLHPQTAGDDVSGEMSVSKSDSDSYVGFSMDDEIMAAIRNELLTKLPHAQGAPTENVTEEEEWDNSERNEVFLRYNVYNTPLSPIPEESFVEDSSGETTPRQESESGGESYCSEYEEDDDQNRYPDTETTSAQQSESPIRGPLHRHTPSQDSCCSNDTLFNLEDLTCAVVAEAESQTNKNVVNDDSKDDNVNKSEVTQEIANIEEVCDTNTQTLGDEIKSSIDTVSKSNDYIKDFLHNERENSSITVVKITEATEEISSDTPSSTTDHIPPFMKKQFVPPLPSPEDKPWKQLPASMLSYDKVIYNNVTDTKDSMTDSDDITLCKEPGESQYENISVSDNTDKEVYYDRVANTEYENIENINPNYENVPNNKSEIDDKSDYENINKLKGDYENLRTVKSEYENVETLKPVYENIGSVSDIYNEADYVNIVNFENTKNSAEFNNKLTPDDVKQQEFEENDELIINENEDDERDLFGVLTDIRFNGPSDSQFMSTSFSESNDNDEQDWDSGSDTRSSSSGEFIWKLDDLKPLEGIEEETYSDSSVSSGSTTSDEAETPEFVPSAWDKYATPTKSALRSPEKTLERDEKKSKGVWFKKQKYHCVYEYPREPESPILQSHDLWKPQSDFSTFADWEFDADTYLPPPTDDNDILSLNNYTFQPNTNRSSNHLYQLTNIFEPSNSTTDDEFFISSSAKPFDMIGSLSSQFFPGNHNWPVENMTPDSGVEDITPGSLIDDLPVVSGQTPNNVPPLKKLANEIVNRNKKDVCKGSDVLGGLRHTRNKLKLDLPPSPSAFTTNKMFTVEPNIEPIILREKPTFSTFGKSRFLVQHVDTPPDDNNQNKNVSFEALPYKPIVHQNYHNEKNVKTIEENSPELPPYPSIKTQILKEDLDLEKGKTKVEFVRGEASLLDSADEDSGIESSTLERKLSNAL